MSGILIYLCFILLGYIYSCFIFKDKDIYFRGWMGGIIGNIILMAGIVIPATFLGFTCWSHLILLLCSFIPAVYLAEKNGFGYLKKSIVNKGNMVSGINRKIILFVIAPVTLLICAIMTNHVLAPVSEGVASGQSTFGDLQMHLGFITSIAEQKVFPPEYAFLDGHLLNYPFFVNMLSSSLYLFGTSLRLAVLIPGYVISALLVTGFYIVAYRLTKRKAAAVLAVVLFFFGGGFGFAYFMNGAKEDIGIFTSIFTDYYHTPTNLPDYNLRWVNPICDMIIPQRTTMAGWCMFFPLLWTMLECLESKKRNNYIILGILAGCTPMIHTHTFLALGVISAVMFFAYLPDETDKKSYITNWIIYGAVTCAMAFPQLFFWTFRQSVNNDSFLRYGFNWVNKKDTYLWFYLKNWGIVALFAVPAIMHAPKDNKKLLIACGVLMCIAEFILFQPNEYDNNKLIFITYMMLVITVSGWLIHMWDSFDSVKGRAYFAVIIIFAGTFSGILSIIREYKSGAEYVTFTNDDIEIAEYIKENTPSDSLILTSAYHLNPVVTLAGRNIYVGSSLYVFFHGMDEEYYKRKDEIEKAYTGTYDDLVGFCRKYDVDYVYVGENEMNEYNVSKDVTDRLEKVYSVGSEALYKVK